MSYASALAFDLSPVRLNYVGALRGLKPHNLGQKIIYAQIGSYEPETLICLAASNPNGSFYGLMPNALAKAGAEQLAQARKITNVVFTDQPSQIPTQLNYLCCDYSKTKPTQQEQEALFTLAASNLAPGGLLAYRYKAYDNADQILQYLIAEFAPEVSASNEMSFLDDLKNLGSLYFNDHPIARIALEKAIESKMPKAFFETCGTTQEIKSGAFETLAGLLPRDFSFVGEADIGANYIQLAAPAASHAVLDKCREHLLYEPLKDFALGRLVRNDVWVKRPVEQTFDNAELFGQFTYGITSQRDRIPPSVASQGGNVNLVTPIFTRLIDLMSTLPVGIGDFLSHPAGMGFAPDEVVEAVQVLVATGIAQPMRSRYEGGGAANMAKPTWSSSFNEYLNTYDVAQPTIRLASPIVGSAVTLSAREALVLQAVGRVGLPNSAGALQLEIKKIMQKNPSLAAQIMDSTDPSDEVVHNMLSNVLNKDMARWYAYGLLAA